MDWDWSWEDETVRRIHLVLLIGGFVMGFFVGWGATLMAGAMGGAK